MSYKQKSLIYYPPSRPYVWRAPSRRVKARGVKALMGLLGLGVDVVQQSSTSPYIDNSQSSGQYGPGQNVPPANVMPAATAPTMASDGSMMAPAPVTTVPVPVPVPTQVTTVPVPVPVAVPVTTSAPKKGLFSWLSTTKPDGTVTGPLGISWTAWLVGGGAAALVFASRKSEEEGPSESTPNRRRKARRNRRRR